MNFLSIFQSSKSPAELIAPLKKQIEDKLKKPVDKFHFSVDVEKNEVTIAAEGKSETVKDKMIATTMKMGIGMAMKFKGKTSKQKVEVPNFTSATIFYDNEKISLALKLTNGNIQTEKL